MKKYILIISLIVMSPILYMCSQVEYVDLPKVEPVFSEQAQEWGELFAETLTTTAKEVRRQQIELSDREAVEKVSRNITLDILENKGWIAADDSDFNARVRSSSEVETQLPVPLSELLASDELTETQRGVLQRIEEARLSSDSYGEFSNRLATINNEIPAIVPKEEQALLFSVTSILYYGLEAMNDLVDQGLLPGHPEREDIILSQSKSGFSSVMARRRPPRFRWWRRWGRCVAGTLGGLGAGLLNGAVAGAAISWLGSVAGGIIGGVSGGLTGAATFCGRRN